MISIMEKKKAEKGTHGACVMVNGLVWETFKEKGPYQHKREGGDKGSHVNERPGRAFQAD